MTLAGFDVPLFAVIELSQFQREMLQFFQFFSEEEGRPPRLHEIESRFGLSENSARHQIRALQKKGYLLPREMDPSHFRISTIWTGCAGLTDILLAGSICAGIPEDDAQSGQAFLPIPLDQLGLPSGDTLFALQVRGNSMIGKHIVSGDIVVLNKSKMPHHGDVVAALVDGQTTLKTFCEEKGEKFLRAENSAYNDIHPEDELIIQGVMVYLLRGQP